jgi:5-formyltetrahydrofolate cyclo-ligase
MNDETAAPQADPITEQKQAHRAAYRAARKAIAPDIRKKANKAILNKLSASQAVAKSKTILIYAATPNEPALDDLISALTRAGKKVVVPRMTKTPGVMTLWVVRHVDALIPLENAPIRNVDVTRASPVEPKDIDLVLVPGVAFTRTLGRLGQGGGYYDRLFPRLRENVKRIGIGYEIQLADELPIEAHDVPMHAVLTEASVCGDTELLAPIPAAQNGPNLSEIAPKNGEIAPQVLHDASESAATESGQ